MKNKILCMAIITALSTAGLLLGSCGGGGSEVGVNLADTATVRVAITDNKVRFDSVVLTIEEIGIVAANVPTTYYGRDAVDQFPVSIDVLDFPAAEMFHLSEIEVPMPDNGPLCFNQIRFVLAEEGSASCAGLPFCNYVVEFGEIDPHLLITPSGQQSGIKLNTPNQFCVEEGETAVSLVIDFDPNVAIGKKEKKSEAFMLKPTGIRIIEGQWDTPPADYISGTILLPIEALDGVCQSYDTTPLVTVAAESVTDASIPVVTTLSLADAPLLAEELCLLQCVDDVDCQTACEEDLTADCYYTGPFKLLLPQPDDYDVRASWATMIGGVDDVASSSEGVEVVLGY